MKTPIESVYLSVIVPAYNEECRITRTLQTIYRYLTLRPYAWEIVVVLDGAQDGTLKKVREFSKGKENICWINRRENKGKGYTVREGMLAAKGQIRLFTDADNSTDIAHFDKMMPLFDGGDDVVICSRSPKDAEGARQCVPQPALRRVLGHIGNLVVQIAALPGIWDTQCGFKAFTANAARKIFSISKIYGWGFDVEALALARLFNLRIGVVAAFWADNSQSHVKMSTYAEVLVEALRIRWGLLTGDYLRRTRLIACSDGAVERLSDRHSASIAGVRGK